MPLLTAAVRGASSVGGAVLCGATRALAAVRPAAKPLHPQGRVLEACLYRHGVEPPLGVEFLDTVSTDEVVVRESRAIGLPRQLPDIHGLAIKMTNADGTTGDLLFATTGSGRLSRFVLTFSKSTYGRPLTTLLPYSTSAGPIVLGARAVGFSTVELRCSVGDGEWRHFADLRLSETVGADQDISFDPVRNQLPGLEQYGWVTRLRAPAYEEARESRSE
ncbi:hypothetical protein NSZ01_17600 [Nocardioides szechwanensis]|uniref:Phosphodiesterase n=1 Tax=Nocardioides szechwanensis TaxID=1005944 RepID=A0A1G9ZML1_9ACTN|nr:hypothetical protein [Nocardioides szechwanensis]GEP33992.1 hypothetical protein NSZ01_17600 [Nocardioides szechwanensis]SDN22722.1 hypothetical protein SAMN05192576_1789 [Nocardioides szechwanensis]